MIVIPTPEFNKSAKKLTDIIAKKRLKNLIIKLKKANSLREISNVVPIINYPEWYRIRTGDYRLFVRYKDGEIKILLLEYSKRDEKTYRNY